MFFSSRQENAAAAPQFVHDTSSPSAIVLDINEQCPNNDEKLLSSVVLC